MKIGDRVRYSSGFLRSTGQFTGDPAPCSWGPFAEGTVIDIKPDCYDYDHRRALVEVQWDNDSETRVLACNLEVIK